MEADLARLARRTDDDEGAIRAGRHQPEAHASRFVLLGLACNVDVAALARGGEVFARVLGRCRAARWRLSAAFQAERRLERRGLKALEIRVRAGVRRSPMRASKRRNSSPRQESVASTSTFVVTSNTFELERVRETTIARPNSTCMSLASVRRAAENASHPVIAHARSPVPLQAAASAKIVDRNRIFEPSAPILGSNGQRAA